MSKNGSLFQQFPFQFQNNISNCLYQYDPRSTKLGREIIQNSILLIDQIGFEQFTFKKLSKQIHSSEGSIFNYFENEHKLFLYLFSFYWNWLVFRLTFETYNIDDAIEKLKIAIGIFCNTSASIFYIPQIDMEALYRVIINEYPEICLIKEVDASDKQGVLLNYNQFCKQLAAIIEEISPSYQHPVLLVYAVLDSAHKQQFFSENVPSLTEISIGNKKDIEIFFTDMILSVIKHSG